MGQDFRLFRNFRNTSGDKPKFLNFFPEYFSSISYLFFILIFGRVESAPRLSRPPILSVSVENNELWAVQL